MIVRLLWPSRSCRVRGVDARPELLGRVGVAQRVAAQTLYPRLVADPTQAQEEGVVGAGASAAGGGVDPITLQLGRGFERLSEPQGQGHRAGLAGLGLWESGALAERDEPLGEGCKKCGVCFGCHARKRTAFPLENVGARLRTQALSRNSSRTDKIKSLHVSKRVRTVTGLATGFERAEVAARCATPRR